MIRVSRLLSGLGMSPDPQWYTEESQQRGHAVHTIAEAIFAGEEIDPAPAYAGYAKAIRDAWKALPLIPVAIERRLVDFAVNVSGRTDVIGYLRTPVGRYHAGPLVADIKSGDPCPAHGLQLGIYEWLATRHLKSGIPNDLMSQPWQKVGIYVSANGRYRLKAYNDPLDRVTCAALITIANWRHANGLKFDDSGYDARQADDPAAP